MISSKPAGEKNGFTTSPARVAARASRLELLNRGADFNYVAEDGTTLVKLLTKQRQDFPDESQPLPPEFGKLWSWLAEHNLVPKQP